jgi:hypothetical protein
MKICPAFYSITWIWIRFCKKCQKKLSDCEFRENWRSENLPLLVGTVELMSDLAETCVSNMYILLLSICEFPENRYSEGHTFLMGIAETIRMYRPVIYFGRNASVKYAY